MKTSHKAIIIVGLAGSLLLASAKVGGTPATIDLPTFERLAIQSNLALKAKDAEIARADNDLSKAQREADRVNWLEKYSKSSAYTKAIVQEVTPEEKAKEKLRLQQERLQVEVRERIDAQTLWHRYFLAQAHRELTEQQVQENAHQQQLWDKKFSLGLISTLEHQTRLLALQPTEDDVVAEVRKQDLAFQKLKSRLYTLKQDEIAAADITPDVTTMDEAQLMQTAFAQDLTLLRAKDTLELTKQRLALGERSLTEAQEDREILADLQAAATEQQMLVEQNKDELEFLIQKALLDLSLSKLEMDHLQHVYQLADRQYQVDLVQEKQGNLPGGSKASELKRRAAQLNCQGATITYDQLHQLITAGLVREGTP